MGWFGSGGGVGGGSAPLLDTWATEVPLFSSELSTCGPSVMEVDELLGDVDAD